MANNDLRRLERDVYAARESNGMVAMLAYAEAHVDLLLNRLRVCELQEVKSTQGEIKAYTAIITAMTKPPFDL